MNITVWQLKLRYGGTSAYGKPAYTAWAISCDRKYYYRVVNTTIPIEQWEFERVIENPWLYYFSTACKLEPRIGYAQIQNEKQRVSQSNM